jgi:hypothetical protein
MVTRNPAALVSSILIYTDNEEQAIKSTEVSTISDRLRSGLAGGSRMWCARGLHAVRAYYHARSQASKKKARSTAPCNANLHICCIYTFDMHVRAAGNLHRHPSLLILDYHDDYDFNSLHRRATETSPRLTCAESAPQPHAARSKPLAEARSPPRLAAAAPRFPPWLAVQDCQEENEVRY